MAQGSKGPAGPAWHVHCAAVCAESLPEATTMVRQVLGGVHNASLPTVRAVMFHGVRNVRGHQGHGPFLTHEGAMQLATEGRVSTVNSRDRYQTCCAWGHHCGAQGHNSAYTTRRRRHVGQQRQPVVWWSLSRLLTSQRTRPNCNCITATTYSSSRQARTGTQARMFLSRQVVKRASRQKSKQASRRSGLHLQPPEAPITHKTPSRSSGLREGRSQ